MTRTLSSPRRLASEGHLKKIKLETLVVVLSAAAIAHLKVSLRCEEQLNNPYVFDVNGVWLKFSMDWMFVVWLGLTIRTCNDLVRDSYYCEEAIEKMQPVRCKALAVLTETSDDHGPKAGQASTHRRSQWST